MRVAALLLLLLLLLPLLRDVGAEHSAGGSIVSEPRKVRRRSCFCVSVPSSRSNAERGSTATATAVVTAAPGAVAAATSAATAVATVAAVAAAAATTAAGAVNAAAANYCCFHCVPRGGQRRSVCERVSAGVTCIT